MNYCRLSTKTTSSTVQVATC